MSKDDTYIPFPRGPLYAAGALIAFSMLLAGLGSLGYIEKSPVPRGQVVESMLLRFEDIPGGGIAVLDAATNQTVETIAPGVNGFMRITLRSLARERRKRDIGSEPPFRLTLWNDGRLSLDDTATGKSIGLHAFGAQNAATFTALLAPRMRAKSSGVATQ